MKTQTAFYWILTVSAFAATVMLPRQTQARACAVASDCPKGWDCVAAESDGGPTGTCTSLPCQSDSDCGPGLSCFIWGWSLGSGVPASATTPSLFAPDGGRGSACLPQWEVACTSDSDCGPGFTCPPSAGGFGGSYNCGKDQDASEPPYATVTTVPCSAVPTPGLPFGDAGPPPGFPIPSICEPGTTCTEVSWNNCAAPQTTPCSVDSDCPSTWTCGCETNCDGQVLTADGSCMTVCMAPNSDLFAGEICNGGAAGGSFAPSGSTSAPSAPAASGSGVDAAASGKSPSTGGSSSGHGGCQVGSDHASASWILVMAGVLAAARCRPRRKRQRS
jgi:MYXO-CTERM domain-containing protein